MTNIYGIDTEQEVTPIMVRDAVVSCFNEAHCSQLEFEGTDDSTNQDYCLQIVRKAFEETSGNFDLPTKNSIIAVLPWLADFSKTFRDQTTIQKHMSEIQTLITLLD